MTKNAKRYYKEIKALIPSKSNYEITLLDSIKMRILEIDDSTDNVTYDDLCDLLGSPRLIIANYFENVDVDCLLKRLHITKTMRICAYTALAVVIMCSVLIAGYYHSTYKKASYAIVEENSVKLTD